ncbi:MAG: DUF29 domain-containing protein [Microcystaceae cyanobacterium]
MQTQLLPQSLYEQDYCLWLETTLKQLKARNLEYLDWEHLIEEIETLGNEQRHKVDSYLAQLLIHLLLYQYWQQERDYCGRGWENEISNFRLQLDLLFESKTLFNHFLERIGIIYPKARRQAVLKTKLPASTFPEQCPYMPEQILDFDYLPG